MNKHVLLILKWINDPESVTEAELKNNRDAACATYHADVDAVHAYCVAKAANFACFCFASAEREVTKYFTRSGEDRQQYFDALAPPPAIDSDKAMHDIISDVPGVLESLDIPVSDIVAALIKAGYHT